MPNRLDGEASPYLRQHRENPVDWFPWGDEAFTRAKLLDRPVFLSVGYSSCHWCHVMAHESFEDDGIAAQLNDSFISVKVDREERPDVDEAYMTAVQLMAGRGGWPMSVFLTPDRRPFFAGTYFPRDDRGQNPGFATVLRQLSAAWRDRRVEVERAADELAGALRQALEARPPASNTTLDGAFVEAGIRHILSDFDAENGGFGGAPKFPPHSGLELLLGGVLRESLDPEVRQACLTAALFTLREMALGGIHDHVGGGFHRYSTDAEWHLPHFEKMLYDNALLLSNFTRGAEIALHLEPSLGELFRATADGIAEWMAREMRCADGTFASALDADSEGEEGSFYIWTVAEVEEVLGDRAPAFVTAYGFAPDGNYLDEATRQLTGSNIPHLAHSGAGDFRAELELLRAARERRVRPGRDDKALVGWNGLAIGALAEAGAIQLAESTALAILSAAEGQPHLPHQITNGVASGTGFLDDYAHFSDGLLRLAAVLHELHAEGRALDSVRTPDFYAAHAQRLISEMIEHFYDSAQGGFFATSTSHERLFGRTKPVFDQPIPSANATAIRLLLAVGDVARAQRSLKGLMGWMERAPQATEALFAVAMMALDGGVMEATVAPL